MSADRPFQIICLRQSEVKAEVTKENPSLVAINKRMNKTYANRTTMNGTLIVADILEMFPALKMEAQV